MTDKERGYLRELAARQADIANSPLMEAREKNWYHLNDAGPFVPPVIIETWTFDAEMMPGGVYRCEDPGALAIEKQLLRNLREHDLIHDDKVMPQTFDVPWRYAEKEFGFDKPIEERHATDSSGRSVGFQYEYPIRDVSEDLHILKPYEFTQKRAETIAFYDLANETIGDILPARYKTANCGINLTYDVVRLMSMEKFFFSMYDYPDEMARLMDYLADNVLACVKYLEENSLLELNNGNDHCASSYNFTRKFPPEGCPGKARAADIIGRATSQETVGMSPAMFRESILPYYQKACAPFGGIYYGCCEPVHPFFEDLKKALPQMTKVSISKWCDQDIMGEQLRESPIVYSRKPDPMIIGHAGALDGQAWRDEIAKTMRSAKGCRIEFILRDIYIVGSLEKVRLALDIAREEIQNAL